MKLYEKPELSKVDVYANERLMNDCIVGSEAPNDIQIPVDCNLEVPQS